jgi:predicted acyltransferase
MTEKKRLLALDVMRGITIAGMLLVNDPGSWDTVYAPLCHSEWNGLTPTDLVYPFFMFIMGVSTYFSLSKYGEGLSMKAFQKITVRGIGIFLIGLGLSLLVMLFSGGDSIRIMGVLQRLGIVYFGGALIALLLHNKHLLITSALILLVYCIILYFGDGYAQSANNIIAKVDYAILGKSHLYVDHFSNGSSLIFEPEAILSNLPCFAHVLFGIYVGKIIANYSDNRERLLRIFTFGSIILFVGLLLQYGVPINKKIWSTTFVLVTCGFASLFLSLLIWIIDMSERKKWTPFFECFGINPLFMYVMGSILAMLFIYIPIPVGTETMDIKGFIFKDCLLTLFGNPYFTSLIYAVLFVGFVWIFGLYFYKKRIYIKL